MMNSDFLRRQLLAVEEDSSNASFVELTTQFDTDLRNLRPPKNNVHTTRPTMRSSQHISPSNQQVKAPYSNSMIDQKNETGLLSFYKTMDQNTSPIESSP